MPRHSRAIIALLSTVVTTATPSFAQPQPATPTPSDEVRAGARAAALEGSKAMDEKRWSDAIDFFTRAESLVHAPTHLLYLARAHVKLGHLVKASEIYLKVMRENVPAYAPKPFREAVSSAEKEVQEITPKIGQLRIVLVGASPEDVKITLDDAVVPPALVGLSNPTDPGIHQLKAEGDAFAPVPPQLIKLADGGNNSVTFTFVPKEAHSKAAAPLIDKNASKSHFRGRDAGEIVAFTVGGAGIVVGTVFLIKNLTKRSDANSLCPGSMCSIGLRSQVDALDSSANQAATISWISYIVGAVGIGTGITLVATDKRVAPSNKEKKVSLTPWFGTTMAGVSGTF